MTRENVKKALPILQAFTEGKMIQYKNYAGWIDTDNTLAVGGVFSHPERYRIKPSPKYRPFKNADECWQEMQKHQPFGWVYTDEKKAYRNILSVDFAKMPLVLIPDQGSFTLNDMFEYYTFADGKPFGVKEEEN